MTWALHLANCLILCSFLMRNMLVLRLLSIFGGVFFATYFLSQNPPMTAPVKWNMLFGCVNLFQIVRILLNNRKIPLSIEEYTIKELFFQPLKPLEIKKLCSLSQPREIPAGENISLSTDEVGLLIQGNLSANKLVLQKGDFLGVSTYLGGNQQIRLAVAQEPTTLYCWPHKELQEWSDQNPERKTLLLSAFSSDLLKKMNPI